jgi:hypothetical protein
LSVTLSRPPEVAVVIISGGRCPAGHFDCTVLTCCNTIVGAVHKQASVNLSTLIWTLYDLLVLVSNKVIPEMKQASDSAARLMYAMMGVEDLLLCPPVDNPRNVLDFGLFTTRYKVGGTLCSCTHEWSVLSLLQSLQYRENVP